MERKEIEDKTETGDEFDEEDKEQLQGACQ